jgi:hypothetical protein
MEDHFIYIQGYPESVQINSHEEQQLRDALIGHRRSDYISIIHADKKLLVRVSDISVLESRPKVSV